MTHPAAEKGKWMRESTMWAHVWMALYRPGVLWGGPYPRPWWIAGENT